MCFRNYGAAALAVCVVLVVSSQAEAAKKRNYQTASSSAKSASESLASYNSIEQCDYSTCRGGNSACGNGSNLGLGASLLDRQAQFFAYGEYIYARASFSEAVAYIVSDANDPQGGQDIVEFDFDYNSSYRFGGGINFCDCGGAIVFNFARYNNSADFDVTDTSTQQGATIFSPYEIDAPGAGGSLEGSADVDVKSYDVGMSKTIPLGCPLGCCNSGCDSGCDSCCDTCCGGGGGGCGGGNGCGCGCGGCPAWDITWTAALRFAQVDWNRGTTAFESNGNQVDSANTRLDFDGAGARVGVLGRRYIGQSGCLSIYAKGDISLLVGEMNIRTDTIDDPDGTAPLALRSYSNSGTRMIPVTEIEAGLSAQLTNNIQLSSGYFLAAWHDLGMRDQYDWTIPGLQLSHFDDANILGFDGFFARAVVSY